MHRKTRNNLLPWLMWLLAAFFYCYEFFLQVSPGVMVKELMHAFGVNAASLGFLASLYYYAYAAMQIPAGVLLDGFGARRLLTFAAFMCAIGCLIFGSSHLLAIAAIGRLLIGLGSAFAVISCMYIAATWLPTKIFSFLTGIMLSIGMIGAICGQAPLALLVARLNWQKTILILGAVGLVIAICSWLVIKDDKKHEDMHDAERKLLDGLKILFFNGQNWICAIYAGLMFTPTIILGSIWGVPFVTHKYHITTTLAATLVSMLFLGWAICAPLFGWLSDYYKKRKLFLLIGTIGALISLLLLIYLPPIPHIILAIILFCCGAFSSALIIAFSVAREINPASATGAAIGFMNCINMVGGILIPPLVGLILDYHFSFTVALTILPCSLTIALIMLFLLHEPITPKV